MTNGIWGVILALPSAMAENLKRLVTSMIWNMFALFLLIVFYAVYLGKMLSQRRRGIQTDQIAKGKERGKRHTVELLMKIATYSVVAAEVLSICLDWSLLPGSARAAGLLLAVLGDAIFAVSVWTMHDSWRAGIAERDRTELVTSGIYQFSRNPAFLGFDLVYLGILLMFFNPLLLVFSLFAAVMLHLQILQEEQYLPEAFGESYLAYRSAVNRYFGRRRPGRTCPGEEPCFSQTLLSLPKETFTRGGIVIRKIENDDDLWYAVIQCRLAPGQEDFVNPAGFSIGRAYLRPADNLPCVICRENGEPIGFIIFRRWLGRGEAYNWSYYLDQRWQGQGYGEKAARLAVQILKAAAPDMPIKLSTEADNHRAQALYQKIGFQKLDELDGDDFVFML